MKKLLFFALSIIVCSAAFSQQNSYSTVLASAVQTAATVNTSDQINASWAGAQVTINVSAYTSGNYTPHIQAKDPVSGTYYDVLVGPAISATGITILKVRPGIAVVSNGSAADMLPQTWRVQLIGLSTPSMTLSVGAFLVK